MNLESLTNKQLYQLEHLATELNDLIKQAGLTDDPLYHKLMELSETAADLRGLRYDVDNPSFKEH